MQLRGILPSTDTFRNENVGEEECREEDNNHVRIAKALVDAQLALTGPTGQPSDRLKPLSFLLSSVS